MKFHLFSFYGGEFYSAQRSGCLSRNRTRTDGISNRHIRIYVKNCIVFYEGKFYFAQRSGCLSRNRTRTDEISNRYLWIYVKKSHRNFMEVNFKQYSGYSLRNDILCQQESPENFVYIIAQPRQSVNCYS